MNNQIQTMIDFLLDTETTSEVLFNQTILEKEALYHKRHQASFERVVNQKLQQWKDYDQKKRSVMADRIAISVGNEASGEQSESELEKELSFDDVGEGEACHRENQVLQPIEPPDINIDSLGQCKRLLQLLYHCQENHGHFVSLYFYTLDHCIKNDNEMISAIALQQIAVHLSDHANDRSRLIEYLPSDFSSPTIPQLHQPILSTIANLLSTKQVAVISSHDLDTLYPQTARFLDLRREFRDSTHYFIDGDSLVLSVAHHINIDLTSYFGNTLHVIFIIERILLTLFNQGHHPNYTLLFFDCHHQLYRNEKSIFSLLRACLIAHLSRNIDRNRAPKVRQFSSWLDGEYVEYHSEEKPQFLFYHDMSSFDLREPVLLSEDCLQRLRYVYRLFGNYHQYYLQCHLYLMNKLILTDTTVQCFHVKFKRQCPMTLFRKVIEAASISRRNTEKDEWDNMIEKEISQEDVRLFLYLKTIVQSNQKDMSELLSPLLILHVALLIRLSLIDRHLPSDCPSIEFSPKLSKLIHEFQERLAYNLSSNSSASSWLKIGDIFDGRLFAFTLYQLHQSSSKIYFDADTMDIIRESFNLLKISNNENRLGYCVEQLIRTEDVIILPTRTVIDLRSLNTQKIARISNPFIDTLLKPILSIDHKRTFDFVNPEDNHLSRYEGRFFSCSSDIRTHILLLGKYHWHVYKEVSVIISNTILYLNSCFRLVMRSVVYETMMRILGVPLNIVIERNNNNN